MSLETKFFYYVAVEKDGNVRLVTQINSHPRWCEWNIDEKPLPFKLQTAKKLCCGLRLNDNNAFVLTSQVQLTKNFGRA